MQISKYNASGNDFIIFHTFREVDRSELAKRLCNRQSGIGADGLIVLLPSSEYDFKWQFYNSDGSDAAMCGNGTRACAHYAYKNSLANRDMSFLTQAGVISSYVEEDVVETLLSDPKKLGDKFMQDGRNWYFYDTGVPHLITFVDDISEFDKELAAKMRYAYNANVNFASIKDDGLFVRTYERGVEDETLACGTGMAACFFSAYENGEISSYTKVYPTSKEELELRIENGKLYFKGKVSKVFDTSIDAD
ncbi:MAG: diaminopimelate epimerase [Sulfurospirillaceae bacterium]|nr:diaminopimelate epimerase [Sulfurospirillaceae bacterium]